jgi:hypothetical protein
MATSTTTVQAAESSVIASSVPTSLVSDNNCSRSARALNPSSKMPELGQSVQIPGLGDLENPSQQLVLVNSSDYGCHDTTIQVPDLSSSSGSTAEPTSPSQTIIDPDPDPQNTNDLQQEAFDESYDGPEGQSGAEIAEQTANDQWQRQNMEFQMNQNIHHFNFLGKGVTLKNATPPAVSLFVAVRGAKAGYLDKADLVPKDKEKEKQQPVDLDDPLGYAVMHNAMKLVDPVIYHGPSDRLWLRGEHLREAVTGLCENLYSEHGTWRDDGYSKEEDCPVLDEMDVHGYPVDSLPVNGWFQSRVTMDRWDMKMHSYNLRKWHEGLQGELTRRKRACEREGSLLRHMTTVEDLVVESEDVETKDVDTKVEVEMPKAEVPSNNGEPSKKADSAWTVDLDKYFGKCDNWADEIDEEDEIPVAATPFTPDNPPSPKIPTIIVGDWNSDTGVNATTLPPTSDDVTTREPLAESTQTAGEASVIEGDEFNALPFTPSTFSHGTGYDAATPSSAQINVKGQAMEGLSEEELQAEDDEIYGDSSPASEDVDYLVQRLRESGLVTQTTGALSSSDSDEQEEDFEDFAATTKSMPITLGASFSLPIREKPVAPMKNLPAAAADVQNAVTLTTSAKSFSLPIRAKLAAIIEESEEDVIDPSGSTNDDNQTTSPAAENDKSDDLSFRSPTVPWLETLSASEKEAEIDADEHMSPIPSEALDCLVLPLRPRKPHGRRLTDSPFDLLQTSSKAWSKHNQPSDVVDLVIMSPERMMEKFKNAPSSPMKEYSALPRSKSFPDLKALAEKKSRRPNTRRYSSLLSTAELEKAAKMPLTKPRTRSNIDKVEAISEEDEVEDGITTSLKESKCSPTAPAVTTAKADAIKPSDEDAADESAQAKVYGESALATPPASPARSPYKRLASITHDKVMREPLRSGVAEEANGDDSTEDMAWPEGTEDTNVPVGGTGDHDFFPCNSWSGKLGHEETVDQPLPAPINLSDVPYLGFWPISDSSTATESAPSNSSTSNSSHNSTNDTGVTTLLEPTTPPPASPKTIHDIHFTLTRPRKPTTWAKIKSKLTKPERSSSSEPKVKVKSKFTDSDSASASPPMPEVTASKKTKRVGKSVKKFLRKTIEAFAVGGQTGF